MFVFFAALYEAPKGPAPDEEEVQRQVRAARLGNASAARRLYDACAHRVYRAVRPLCVSDADAEDATQDAFIDALTHLHRYTPHEGTRFVGWVATLGLNRARKRRAKVDKHEAKTVDEAVPSGEEQALLKRSLLAALSTLPERERQAVSLRYGAELEATEVAELLGLSSDNVRKICERAKAKLAEQLGGAR